MLIKALCDYYDILAQEGKVLPDGYSNVKIHYLISLTEDGRMDEIIDCQKQEEVPAGKGKTKIRKLPVEMMMPQRTEKSGIESSIVEHRPAYIFGLNWETDGLSPDDRTDKARKSHRAFVEANLKFTDGLSSPVVAAYRNFLTAWQPEKEKENPWLLRLGKDYGKSGFAFCLSGSPDILLHEDSALKEKWETQCEEHQGNGTERTGQCAVTGVTAPIARIHSKIKGVYGGLATGSVLIGFNNDSENSYGNEQSYNSNISETAMKKYTEALNYLLASSRHKVMLDEMTVVFWAMSSKEEYQDLFSALLMGPSDQMGAGQTEQMLKELMVDAANAKVVGERLQSLDQIDPNVDFYMLGLKPNSSRLSVKFILRRKYADVLWNIARFQKELQVTKEAHSVSLWQIKNELISPKSKNDKVDPALMARLLEAIIYGSAYPGFLLSTMVRRVKTDSGNDAITPGRARIRAGVIKACINRNNAKEELKVALDRENQNPAYLCGRLFAVLEKLQQEASGNSLNRTIKDAYFASASAKPALVFPKLIRLAQNHLNKVKYPVVYNKLIGEITNGLNGEFPETLFFKDQGRFIVGYYQQYQSFFERGDQSEKREENE
mgnify:CR=1 FL=1